MADNRLRVFESLKLSPDEWVSLGLKPTEILFSVNDKRFHVSVPAIGEYGVGDSLKEALEDAAKSIHTFYAFLTAYKNTLSPELTKTLKKFEDVVLV